MHTSVASLPTGTVTFVIGSANVGISKNNKNNNENGAYILTINMHVYIMIY